MLFCYKKILELLKTKYLLIRVAFLIISLRDLYLATYDNLSL